MDRDRHLTRGFLDPSLEPIDNRLQLARIRIEHRSIQVFGDFGDMWNWLLEVCEFRCAVLCLVVF